MKKASAKYLLILITLTALLASSCNSYKRLTYMQNIAAAQDTSYQKNKEVYRLQPADILYIRVITGQEEIDKLYNPILLQGSGNMTQMRSENIYLLGFEISDSGYIDLPAVDKIYVNGLTLEMAKDTIISKATTYLRDPEVIVKMHTFQFTILGEVKSPGIKEYGAYELNILEALALGGDITYNGNREKLVIIRPDGNRNKVFRVDLTNKDIVGTTDFYIQPNDIIYVEPLRSTLFRETTSDYMFFVSALSSLLSLTVLIISLTR